MSPAVRREAVEVLFGRGDGINAVIAALESRAMTASELDPARLCSYAHAPGRRDPVASPKNPRLGDVDLARSGPCSASYRPAVTLVGNREQGREIFGKICATCHQAEGRGIEVGPNLATVTGRSARTFFSTSSIQTGRSPRTT